MTTIDMTPATAAFMSPDLAFNQIVDAWEDPKNISDFNVAASTLNLSGARVRDPHRLTGYCYRTDQYPLLGHLTLR